MVRIPLFPLNTVLFPGGLLPLRVFETRYIDMVSQALRENSQIGIVLIREGEEVGKAAAVESVGTSARILDCDSKRPGVLEIIVRGEQRFNVLETFVEADELVVAHSAPIPNDEAMVLRPEFRYLSDLLRKLLIKDMGNDVHTAFPFDDTGWVANRLAEALMMPLEDKQALLSENDPLARIARVEEILHHTGNEHAQRNSIHLQS